MRIYVFLLMAVAVILSGRAAWAQGYLFQPGDVIEVTVIEDPNLNRRVLIAPDGRISLPLAGSVRAAGRSVGQVTSSIRSALNRNFVTPPTVTVSLIALAPPPLPEAPPPPPEPEEIVLWTVYVVGEVRSPGPYTYEAEKPVTVLQALTLAGGLDSFAARNRIQIRRATGGTETLRLFDYDALENEEGFPPSEFLQDGDVILVPERGLFD